MRKYIISLLILILSLQVVASAAVLTTQKTDGLGECVYVAGSHDMYPVEFYDEKTDEYCGIVPDILKKISEDTGIDFVYINGDKSDKLLMGKNLQVEIVSSITEEETWGYKDFIPLLVYDNGGEKQSVGLGFTSISDDSLIKEIKLSAEKISSDELNSVILGYAGAPESKGQVWMIIAAAVIIVLLIFVVRGVVRIKRLKKENEVDKMIDEETGMGNLRHFQYHFKYTIGDISRNIYYLAYIILDSNYLRSYHGESSFSDVLRYTVSVLSEYAEDREFAARISESGFVMALQCTNEENAARRVTEILAKLNSFEGAEGRNNKLVFHGAYYHLASSDRNSEILLFNLRKNAMKIFGTNKQIVYCDVHSMNRVQEEKKITESILAGFEKNEFKMFLQFIVDSKTKKIASAEALSRWDSPSEGLVGPGKYIANMEQAGLISKHDLYMFECACVQLEKWSITKYKDVSISCNFTRITLSEETFVDKLKMIADAYEFDRSRLAIEITEDAMEKNRAVAMRNVQKCKELGFRIYLDDMGSGYTSLANLCDYPIDVVKIDRDILLKTNEARGKSLFWGIVALAHSLGIKVVCEGVETEEQNTLACDAGCDLVQGWYYSKALPLEECESFMERYEGKLLSK